MYGDYNTERKSLVTYFRFIPFFLTLSNLNQYCRSPNVCQPHYLANIMGLEDKMFTRKRTTCRQTPHSINYLTIMPLYSNANRSAVMLTLTLCAVMLTLILPAVMLTLTLSAVMLTLVILPAVMLTLTLPAVMLTLILLAAARSHCGYI